MNRLRAIVLVSLALSGCAKPDVEACDRAIKKTLRSPSTYKRAATKYYENTPGRIESLVAYDAENGFGGKIRAEGDCVFHPDTKQAEWVGKPASLGRELD